MSAVSVKMSCRMAETVVLLHGFAGTRHAWDLGRRPPRPGTLPAARAGSPRPRGGARRAADHVRRLRRGRRRAGARALRAVRLLDGRPDRAARRARAPRARRAARARREHGRDRGPGARGPSAAPPTSALAADTERGTIEEFADRWSRQPLFAGTPPRALAFWRADLLRNDPVALAAALRGIGTGAMEPLWDRLGELADARHGHRGRARRALHVASGGASRARSRTRGCSSCRAPATGSRARRRRPWRRRSGPRGDGRRRGAVRRRARAPRARRSRPRVTGRTSSSSANSSSVPSPHAALGRSAAAQCTAAAIPSGPSKVEAR